MVCAVICGGPAARARAEEPSIPSEPKVMREPGERVDVIDAFDDKDPIDIDIGLAFAFETKRGTLSREDAEVASYTASASRLLPRVAVGVFRDVSIGAGLAIVLDETVRIDREGDATIATAAGETIVNLPFRGPSRSGFEEMWLGVNVAPLNQMRGSPLSMRVSLEGHLSAFAARHPCDEDGCRRLVRGGPIPTAGTTTGLLGTELAVTVSRRFLSVEPYARVAGRLDVAVEGALHDIAAAGGDLPKTFSGMLGTMLVPWENRESFGRVTIDVGVSVQVESAGFGFSVLSDAIGSSPWIALDAEPRPSGVLSGGPRVFGRLTSEGLWQASRFVKLGFGFNGSYEGERVVTRGDQISSSGVPAAARAELGRPISSSAVFGFDLSSRGVVMF